MSGLRRFLLGLSGLLFLLTMLIAPVSALERNVFEKGDVLVSEMLGRISGRIVPVWFFGHAGLYYKWLDGITDEVVLKGVDAYVVLPSSTGYPNDPDPQYEGDRFWMLDHRTLESGSHGPDDFDFKGFYEPEGGFWGVWTPSEPLKWDQREFIMLTAEELVKADARYSFTFPWANTNPSVWWKPWSWPGPSFRCDGLVDYCYHQAGSPIIDRMGPLSWWTRWPKMLKTHEGEDGQTVLRERLKAEVNPQTGTGEVEEVRLLPSEEGTLKAYASDGEFGSGITMVEFWDGIPDNTPETWEGTGKRLGYDTHNVIYAQGYDSHTYTIDFDGTITNGLVGKAFDQAGNTLAVGQFRGTRVNSQRPTENFSHERFGVAASCHYAVPGSAGGCNCENIAYFKSSLTGHDYLNVYIPNTWHVYGYCSFVELRVNVVDPEELCIEEVTWETRPSHGDVLWSAVYPVFGLHGPWIEPGWLSIPIDANRAVSLTLSSDAEVWAYMPVWDFRMENLAR